MPGLQNDAGTVQQEAGFGFDGTFWCESSFDGVTATAGGGRAAAKKIAAMYTRFSTVASAGDSAVLPPIVQKLGLTVCIINDGANAMQVFADGTDTINGIAGATGVPQMTKSVVYYTALSTGKWHAQGLGSGFSGANQTYSFSEGLTAFAGGGQGSATQIVNGTARFTTVATAGDSAKLMTAAPGLAITVINNGAQIMNLFPATGEQINNLGANIAFAIPSGAAADFYCTLAGTWHSIMSSTAAQQAYVAVSTNTGFTLTGAQIAGGTTYVFLDLTGSLGGNANVQLPTVAALVTAMTVAGVNPAAGMSIELVVCERSAANTWTITTNTGWTLTGTMTLGASGVTRKFILTLTSLTAATLTSLGSFTLTAA